LITTRRRLLPQPLGAFAAVVSRGHFGVVVFIVLSGFSLMLPVTRSTASELPGGLGGYVRRRARRIAPPYYAALALSIAVIAAYNTVGPRVGLGSRVPAADLSFGSIVSHMFLVHNVSSAWVNRINGPMWSVATEWQIYFLFALLLLPLARRVSIFAVVIGAWVASSLPFFLLPYRNSLSWAYPWMVGAFALGMFGATIGFGPRFRTSRWRTHVPWGVVSLAALGAVVLLVAAGWADTWPAPIVDLFVSILALAVINACWQREAPGFLTRVLASRFLVFIGGFSYSLYLFQDIVLKLTQKVFVKAAVTPTVGVMAHLLIVVPGTIAGAWLFAEFFERPFTGSATLRPPGEPAHAGHCGG
jgi:peptidoglycan/LPS O-acetylase OafA/YrhL